MMLLLNTVKLVLITLNILPFRFRFTHKKILFAIYILTLVTHGEYNLWKFHVFIPLY
jgi:hypothetical protein